MKRGEMKICNQHEERVPLIWTFKFNGAEYWCPYCGYLGGMFGAGENVARTEKLEKSLEEWTELARPYLSGEIKEWSYNADRLTTERED